MRRNCTTTGGRPGILAVLGACAMWFSGGGSIWAQPALRASLAGARAAEVRRQALEEGGYTLKGGALRMLLRTSLDVECNDNISYSGPRQLSDFIAVPHVGADILWRVTAGNALKVGVDLGYRFYTTHPEYNRPDFGRAGSEVSFDLYAGDFVFTPYDRFQYRYDLGAYGAAAGVSNYGGLDNTLGMNALWDLNDVVVTCGYGWNFFHSDQPDFSYQNRNSHFVLTRVALLPLRPLVGGVEATVGVNEYSEPILNNSRQGSFGGFLEWPLTKFVTLTVRGGAVVFAFDQTGLLISQGTVSAPYYELTLAHRVNRYLSHSLNVGRSLNLGFNSDLQSRLDVRYGMSFSGIRKVPLSWGVFYEQGEEPAVEFPQTWDRFGFQVGVGYRFARKLTSTLAYRVFFRQGGHSRFDYTQNVGSLSLSYRF